MAIFKQEKKMIKKPKKMFFKIIHQFPGQIRRYSQKTVLKNTKLGVNSVFCTAFLLQTRLFKHFSLKRRA